MSEAGVRKELMVHIDGRALQPPKRILAKDQLLELAGLDPERHESSLSTARARRTRQTATKGWSCRMASNSGYARTMLRSF